MSIEWLSTKINPPLADKEIIAKNPIKPVGHNSATKKCKIIKFNKRFNEDLIVEIMLSDNLTLWSYTDE